MWFVYYSDIETFVLKNSSYYTGGLNKIFYLFIRWTSILNHNLLTNKIVKSIFTVLILLFRIPSCYWMLTIIQADNFVCNLSRFSISIDFGYTNIGYNSQSFSLYVYFLGPGEWVSLGKVLCSRYTKRVSAHHENFLNNDDSSFL